MASVLQRCVSLLAYLTVVQIFLGNSTSAKKVSLDLYYESLCPYSANFIINELPIIYQNGLIDIVDLRLFPWGNGRLTSNNSFSCQHGPTECLFNTIEACAIDAWPDVDVHFAFITCVENELYEGKFTQWDTCFKSLSLDPKPVIDCYKGEYGEKLELKYANLTDALEPPHKYVPWVVVDGKPLLEDYENFVSYICKAYKGPLPTACRKDSVLRKTKEVHRVCYAEQTAKAPFPVKNLSFITSWADQMI